MRAGLLGECGLLFDNVFGKGKLKSYDTEALYFMIDHCVALDTNGNAVPVANNTDLLQLRQLLTLAAEENREDCGFKPQYSKVTIETLHPQHPYFSLYSSVGMQVIIWEPSDDRPEYTGNIPAVYPVDMYITVRNADDHYGYLLDEKLDKEIMDALRKIGALVKVNTVEKMDNFN